MRGLITAFLILFAGVAAGQAPTYTLSSDNYVSVTDSDDFDFSATDSLSVSVWVNQASKTDINKYLGIVQKGCYENNNGFEVIVNRNNNAVGNGLGSVSFGVKRSQVWSSVLPINTWTHLVCVSDGVNISIYENGSVFDTSAAQEYVDNADALIIGRRHQDATAYAGFDGKIDDARIYSTALSSNQIARLTLDTCEMYRPTLWTNTTLHAIAETWDTGYGNTNLVGAWRGDRTGKANGQAFTNIVDLSGNNNDGTAVNSPTIEAAR